MGIENAVYWLDVSVSLQRRCRVVLCSSDADRANTRVTDGKR